MLPKKLLDQMPKREAPPSLEELAFESISKYVGSVMQDSLSTYCTQKPRVLNSSEVVETVRLDLSMLHEYLHGSLPRVLGVKMTSHVWKGITAIIDRTKCTNDNFKRTGDDTCRDIVTQFLIVSINPYLTRLDISKESHIIRKVMFENLNLMSKLEVASLRGYDKWDESKDKLLSNLGSLQNLVSFDMGQDSTDDVVIAVGQNCRKLKSLIVKGATSVSNRSINSILRLTNLEQLELCATSLSEGGYIRLLTELPRSIRKKKGDNATSLKMISCSLVRNVTLEILYTYYPNLKVVSLSSLHCDMSLLKNLKFLEQLRLTGGNFMTDNIKGLIQEKGPCLKVLELLLIQEIDVTCLGKYCTELKNLNLRSCSFIEIPLSEGRNKVASFQELEQLVFYIQCSIEYLTYILVNCINVRNITIGLIKDVNDEFIADILSRNPLRKLEEFRVYFSGSLTLRTVQLLMTNCPTITCFGGLETWEGVSQLDLWRTRDELKRHNSKVRISSNCS